MKIKISLIFKLILFVIGMLFLIFLITLLGAILNKAGINNWYVKFIKIIDIFRILT